MTDDGTIPKNDADLTGDTVTPAPPPPADPKSPEALAEYDQETVRLVNDQMQKVDDAETEWITANEDAKAKKGILAAREDELHKLIKERRENRGKPVQRTLLDTVKPAEPAAEPLEEGAPDPLAELWREYPLDRLQQHGMRSTDVARLADGIRKEGDPYPIKTMGDMAGYTDTGAGAARLLSDFKGIGLGGATRIAEATTNFWGWWNAGGRDEYARERGLLDGNAGQPGVGGEGGAGGDPAPGDGQPAGAGADPDAAARAAEERVYGPREEEVATVPEGAGEEFDLAEGE